MTEDAASVEERLLDIIGEKPSFSIPDFLDRVGEGPEWTKLLVAHIYLDHILAETLREHLVNPEAYLSGHRSFVDKLNICQALGFFHNELGKVLKAINNKRNRFAHELAFDVTTQDKSELFRLFTETRSLEAVLSPGGFENFLCSIVLVSEAERVVEGRKKSLSEERQAVLSQLIYVLLES